jgi:hypothetical protein
LLVARAQLSLVPGLQDETESARHSSVRWPAVMTLSPCPSRPPTPSPFKSVGAASAARNEGATAPARRLSELPVSVPHRPPPAGRQLEGFD